MYIVSTASKDHVYHRQGCPYTRRIANEHYAEIRNKIARQPPFRPCRCCIKGKLPVETDEATVRSCCRKEGTRFQYEPEKQRFFLRTSRGFWKMQKGPDKRYTLYHSSVFQPDAPFEELKHKAFHRQGDIAQTRSVQKLITYVQRHDKAMEIIDDDYRKLPRKTKKQKRYYRQAKSRVQRKNLARMDRLFDLIASGADNRTVLAY